MYHYTQFPHPNQLTQSHIQSPVRADGGGDQVVLSRVHALANEALYKVVGDSLQVTPPLVCTTKCVYVS
ncbi:hypothetical protein EON63_08385 [archaeon]|nr:MAG: hypothetical protein EON63_08385 [archaeon]